MRTSGYRTLGARQSLLTHGIKQPPRSLRSCCRNNFVGYLLSKCVGPQPKHQQVVALLDGA
jgi:hypothetical protein